MALFDITAQNAYADFPMFKPLTQTLDLPKSLLAGKSQVNTTQKEITKYLGDKGFLVNVLA